MERSSRVLQHGKTINLNFFHKIKVAKAQKMLVCETALSKVIMGVAKQRTSVARRPPWKQHLYLLPPNKFLYLYLHHTLIIDETLLG